LFRLFSAIQVPLRFDISTNKLALCFLCLSCCCLCKDGVFAHDFDKGTILQGRATNKDTDRTPLRPNRVFIYESDSKEPKTGTVIDETRLFARYFRSSLTPKANGISGSDLFLSYEEYGTEIGELAFASEAWWQRIGLNYKFCGSSRDSCNLFSDIFRDNSVLYFRRIENLVAYDGQILWHGNKEDWPLNAYESTSSYFNIIFERLPLTVGYSNGDKGSDAYAYSGQSYRIAKAIGIVCGAVVLIAFGVSNLFRLNSVGYNDRQNDSKYGSQCVFAFLSVVIGWFLGVYGTALLLPALNDLTFLDCRSEDIRIQPVVVAELELGNVERQIFTADLVIGADHAALNQRPETFDRIGVDCADDILPLGMVDHAVRELAVQTLVSNPLIGAEQADLS
jgi:hypothetical protein